MSPIEPDEAMNLKNFSKEEEAIFDFIVSPMMQKYLKSYIRQVKKYQQVQKERHTKQSQSAKLAFEEHKVNFYIAQQKEDNTGKIPGELANRINAFAGSGGVQAVENDLQQLVNQCNAVRQMADACKMMSQEEERMDEELRAKYGRKWDRQHDDEDNKDNEDALEFFEKKLSDLLENIKAM